MCINKTSGFHLGLNQNLDGCGRPHILLQVSASVSLALISGLRIHHVSPGRSLTDTKGKEGKTITERDREADFIHLAVLK